MNYSCHFWRTKHFVTMNDQFLTIGKIVFHNSTECYKSHKILTLARIFIWTVKIGENCLSTRTLKRHLYEAGNKFYAFLWWKFETFGPQADLVFQESSQDISGNMYLCSEHLKILQKNSILDAHESYVWTSIQDAQKASGVSNLNLDTKARQK